MSSTNRSRMHKDQGRSKKGPKQHASVRPDEYQRVCRGGNPAAWNARCRDNAQKEQKAG